MQNPIPLSLSGLLIQLLAVWLCSFQPAASKPSLTPDGKQTETQPGQDLIRVLEIVDKPANAIKWHGIKSIGELAPESQVVAVGFAGAGKLEHVEMDGRVEATASRTKQEQDFNTHQEGSNSSGSSPVTTGVDSPEFVSSTSPLEQTEPTTPSPGWPLQQSSTTAIAAANTTTTSSAATTESPTTTTTTTTAGPVGVRIDREGDAVFCGEANANGKSNKRLVLDRIVGGHKTEPGEFPFQARLNIRSRRGSGICGGVVLDRWHVLTAAHCMTACVSHQLTTATIETSGVRVTIGDHAIRSDDGELELETDRITPHERYDACNFYANDHDIALIKTASPMPFKFTTDGYGSVNRPCMPSNSSMAYQDGEMAIVSGWGVTRENSGALSNILRYAQVPIVNITKCQETYGSRVTQDHVCAGFAQGGKDSCQGDSGGPLVRVVENRYELVGIVSFGYGCGQANAAGVYTRVASYLDWIRANSNDL